MSHKLQKLLSILVLTLFVAPLALAQQIPTDDDVGRRKLAQTSFKFLKISTDARAAGMGDALTAADMHSSAAMFYNPAGMARLNGSFSAAFGLTQWVAGISYNAVSAAFSPMDGQYGVVGVSLLFSDYGDGFIGTVKSGSGYDDYEDLGLANPKPTTMALGVGYAKALTDRFSVGGNVKYASQDLGDALLSRGAGTTPNKVENAEVHTLAFDFGLLYKTGFESLNFAMSVRNFSQELAYVDENFELPLTFNVGLEMDVLDLTSLNQDMHGLKVAVEAERPRDFTEQLKVGGEYMFMNVLALRAGYSFPERDQGVSLGAGLKYGVGSVGVGIDYAYTSFGDAFGDDSNVNRFGVNLSF